MNTINIISTQNKISSINRNIIRIGRYSPISTNYNDALYATELDFDKKIIDDAIQLTYNKDGSGIYGLYVDKSNNLKLKFARRERIGNPPVTLLVIPEGGDQNGSNGYIDLTTNTIYFEYHDSVGNTFVYKSVTNDFIHLVDAQTNKDISFISQYLSDIKFMENYLHFGKLCYCDGINTYELINKPYNFTNRNYDLNDEIDRNLFYTVFDKVVNMLNDNNIDKNETNRKGMVSMMSAIHKRK